MFAFEIFPINTGTEKIIFVPIETFYFFFIEIIFLEEIWNVDKKFLVIIYSKNLNTYI